MQANPSTSPRRSHHGLVGHVAVVLALAAVALATYWNAFDAGLVLDNRPIIRDADQVHAATAQNVERIFTHDYWWPAALSGAYRPLTTLTYLVNYAVLDNRERPAGYHGVNLLLHCVNASLVYWLGLELAGAWLPAVFMAALFAVHPIGTEGVTNIIGRADLLAAAAVLGGLLLHIRGQRAVRASPWRAALAVTATAGLLCKENAATLVAVVVLYDLVFRLDSEARWSAGRVARQIWGWATGCWLVLLPPLVLWWALRQRFAHAVAPQPLEVTENAMVATDFVTAKLTAIKVLGQSLWQLLWPSRLCWDYSVNETTLFSWQLGSPDDQQAVLALIVFVAIAFAITMLWRRSRAVVFCIGWFFVTVLPTSNLVVLINSMRADRFLYLPVVGAVGCIALAARAVTERWCGGQRRWPAALVYGVLGLLVMVLGGRTRDRNADWRDELTLCAHDVQVCPRSFRTHQCLAAALFTADRRANVDRAMAEAEAAQAILDRDAPRSPLVPGTVLEDLGVYYRAKAALQSGTDSRAWYSRAQAVLERAAQAQQLLDAAHRQAELRRGKASEAIVEIGNPPLYLTLGDVYLQLGEPASATAAFLHARRLDPADTKVYDGLSTAYAAAGDTEGAILSLLQAFLCDGTRQDIWPRLFALYQRLDPNGCAFVRSGGQYQFNHTCPIVQRHICAALERQAEAFGDARQPQGVRDIRENAMPQHGCAAGTSGWSPPG